MRLFINLINMPLLFVFLFVSFKTRSQFYNNTFCISRSMQFFKGHIQPHIHINTIRIKKGERKIFVVLAIDKVG